MGIAREPGASRNVGPGASTHSGDVSAADDVETEAGSPDRERMGNGKRDVTEM